MNKLSTLSEKTQNENIIHELEIRFGNLNSNKFNANIGKLKWHKIAQYFLSLSKNNENIQSYFIQDKIYHKKLATNFFQKYYTNKQVSNLISKKIYYFCNFCEEEQKNKIQNIITMDKIDKYILKQKHEINHLNLQEIENKIMIKEKLKNDIIFDNIKYSHNREINIEPNSLSENFKNILEKRNLYKIRNKVRTCIKLNEFLQLDFSIVNYFDAYNNNECEKTEYNVEIELYKLPINTKNNKKTFLKELISKIKIIQNIICNIKELIFNLHPVNPITLSMLHISYLKTYHYTVTDKADGERMFLIFYNTNIYLKNAFVINNKKKFKNTTNIKLAVLDGEYIKKINTYLIFDILIIENSNKKKIYTDVRFKNLNERLKIINSLKNEFSKINKFKIQIKKFYNIKCNDISTLCRNVKEIWYNRQTIFNYELDGLIFTPNYQPYISCNPKLKTFKWKESITIDVAVQYAYKENFSYFYCIKFNCPQNIQRKQIEIYNPDIISQKDSEKLGIFKENKLILGKKGRIKQQYTSNNINNVNNIIEFKFDFKQQQWCSIRDRNKNKNNSNTHFVVENNVYCILHQLTFTKLHTMLAEKFEFIGALYQNIFAIKKHTFIGGNYNRKNWRDFHNFSKKKLLINTKKYCNTPKHYHLDLGCGVLNDLFKYQYNNYDIVLAIDSSNMLIKEAISRLQKFHYTQCPKYKYWYQKNKNLKIFIVAGDVTKNIKTLDAAFTNDSKIILKLFFEYVGTNFMGFHTIGAMFTIHYFFGSLYNNLPINSTIIDAPKKNIWKFSKQKSFHFLTNILQLLHPTKGLLIGIYTDSNGIINKEFQYKVFGKNIFEIKKFLIKDQKHFYNFSEIINLQNLNYLEITHENLDNCQYLLSEPQLNKNFLDIIFKKINLSPLEKCSDIKNLKLEQFENEFREEEEQKTTNFDLNTFTEAKKLFSLSQMFIYKLNYGVNIKHQIFELTKIINHINQEF